MNIEQFYKLIKDILQIEREGKSFPTHLETLIGAYLEAYRDIDDSCFKGGAEGKSALMAKIEDVCDKITECLDLYSHAKLDDCINKMREILSHESFCAYRVSEGSTWYRSRMVEGRERVLKAKKMFHVPFELVRKIGNNRFSISGYPVFICRILSGLVGRK